MPGVREKCAALSRNRSANANNLKYAYTKGENKFRTRSAFSYFSSFIRKVAIAKFTFRFS